MTETDEVDRIWREGLKRLAPDTTPMVDAEALVDAGSRRSRARVTIAAAAILVVCSGAVAVVLTRHDPATVVRGIDRPPPVVVDLVDAPNGALTIAVPGKVSGHQRQPPQIVLRAGLVEFHIELRSTGHELRLEGVAGFAPVHGPPGVATRIVQLHPGIYRLYCMLPGHAEAGEQIFLDVR
ncbi:MAG TPA: hypothetical protein VGP92_06220 [Acidimicrobiia bacterium]|jgi:hypothetical protein|nr:hypothetical protein [Acidimicrobiia bacterium]